MTDAPEPELTAETPKVIQLVEGLYARQEIDNMGWADLGGQGLVIDALEQRSAGDEVIAAIGDTLGDVPIRTVLNTHTHYDHVALNGRFHSHFGATIVNAKTDQIPTTGRWFEGNRRRCVLLPTPDCHTPEDCVVWFPEDRVLFIGDLFGWGLIPRDGNLKPDVRTLIVSTYEKVIALDAATVVPGHGPLCSNAEMKRWLQYLDWLYQEVAKYPQLDLTLAVVAGTVGPPADMLSWWRFTEWKHADSLKKVFKASKNAWDS